MADFFKYIRDLFKDKGKTAPYLHEMIERDDEYCNSYKLWLGSERYKRMMDFLRLEYQKNLNEENLVGATFYTIDQPSTKGFYLNYRPDMISKAEFRFFFDYLKEKVLELEYLSSVSDVRTYNRPEVTETIERHYLKPRTQPTPDKKLKQSYGNLTIQHILYDDQPHHIKFISHTYRDAQYEAPKDYHTLIEYVLDY